MQLPKVTFKNLRRADYRPYALIVGAVILVVLAVSRLAMTLVGVAKTWTALPFWDMWDSYITWYLNLEPGNIAQWWSQHNEHRILLAKIFFYADLKFDHGSGYLLLYANIVAFVVLLVLLVLALYIVLKDRSQASQNKAIFFYFASAVIIVASSWMQNSNLLWGFQIQFWLVYIFPLAMFLLFGQFHSCPRSPGKQIVLKILFFLCLIGAVCSMSNGLIAAWLAVVLCFMLPTSIKFRSLTITVATLLSFLYSIGYTTPASHVSPISTLIQHPLAVCEYFLAYLGGPMHFTTGLSTIAVAAGFGCLILFAVLTVSTFRQRITYQNEFVLVFFGWFVVTSAFITAAGRASFGTEQAFASRYQTPVLALWAVLIILSSPYLVKFCQKLPISSALVIGISSLLLLPQQIIGAKGDNALRSSRELATIALATDTLDTDVLGTIYYDMPRLMELSNQVKQSGLTILATDQYANLKSDVGLKISSLTPVNCDGWFDSKNAIPNSQTLRVSGWVVGPNLTSYGFSTLRFVDEQNRIVGYLIRGTERIDLINAYGAEWGESGFTGYIFENTLPTSTYISGSNWKCSLPLRASENVLSPTK